MAPYFDSRSEFILIDDGSTDRTYETAAGIQKKYPGARVIKHSRNEGLGVSLRDGFKAATGEGILVLDADLTFHPRDAEKLIEAFRPGVDCVVGSPLLGELAGVHPMRKALSLGVNALYKILLSHELTSTSGIFRLYRASSLAGLNLESRSFDINAEILFKLVREGRTVVEVPVSLTRRQFGRSKINVVREIKNHVRLLAKIFFWRFSSAKPGKSK